MSNQKRNQLLLILAGVLVGVLIYLAPTKESSDSVEDAVAENDHAGHDHSADESDHQSFDSPFFKLNSEDSLYVTNTVSRANQIADIDTKLSLYDSLIQFSIKRNIPPLVALYSAEKAKVVSTETNWMLAGDNYFKAFRLSKGESKSLIEGAIDCYSMVLELNPDNLAAQTATGVAYVEGASQMGVMPMKGIGILKDVINKDPKNVDALTNLGYFAIQSGQYEKAIERFESILEIDPENAEAYLYLTDVYLSQDKNEKGIETLEKYKSLVSDPLVKQQVEDYIKEIENK